MKTRPKTRNSVREIAQRLGVSKSAVSLALSTPPDKCALAGATRQRILEEAERVGYRSNSMARAMRTGRFNAIGLINEARDALYLPAEMVSGIAHALDEAGHHMMMAWMSEAALGEAPRLPSILKSLCCDGLILHYTLRQPTIQGLIEHYRIPSVWINAKLDHDCVHPDDFGGAAFITRRLIGLGHRDIGFATFSGFEHYSVGDRVAGFEAAMREAGLTPRLFEAPSTVLLQDDGHDHRLAWAERFLASPDRPGALICYDMDIAGPVRMAAARAGVRVPEDFSLATFAKHLRNHTGTVLTTMLLPQVELGRAAAEAVLKKIEHPDKILPAIRLPVPMVGSQTIAPPPRR